MTITDRQYVFKLFVAGDGLDSTQASKNIERLCQTHLEEAYELDVIDVLADPMAALENNAVITPMLLLVAPSPRVTILGDLSDTHKVLAALRLSRED